MGSRKLGARRSSISHEPEISDVYKMAVQRALRWAWTEVCARWPASVAHGREEEITAHIQSVLNEHGAEDQRLAPGLELFETVNRGAKVTSADGRIEKAPDLVLRPPVGPGVRNRGDWGVFVECKVVGPERHHSAQAYCDNGVLRFARGEYAARMPSAMMLAYVRDGRAPHGTLDPLLGAAYATQSHNAVTADTSCSGHARAALPEPCVDIFITHLWLASAASPAAQRQGGPRQPQRRTARRR